MAHIIKVMRRPTPTPLWHYVIYEEQLVAIHILFYLILIYELSQMCKIIAVGALAYWI